MNPEKIRSAAKNENALVVAIRFLGSSERFESEVRRKLADFESELVEEAISNLKRRNLINDRRTAESFLRSRSGRRALGAYGLERELKRRGAPEELISELCQGLDQDDRAQSLLASKFRPDVDLKQKGFRFLLSRGFETDTAHKAVRDFFSQGV